MRETVFCPLKHRIGAEEFSVNFFAKVLDK